MSELGTTRDVHVEDHSAGLAKMKEALEFDPATTAVLTVDMHRGHLDMVNATMPAIDRAVAKRLWHRKAGSRYISRLTTQVATLG